MLSVLIFRVHRVMRRSRSGSDPQLHVDKAEERLHVLLPLLLAAGRDRQALGGGGRGKGEEGD